MARYTEPTPHDAPGGDGAGNVGPGDPSERPTSAVKTWTDLTPGATIPYAFGACRVPSFVVYRGKNDVSEKVYDSVLSSMSHAGRGSSAVLAICHGPVARIGRFWRGKDAAPSTSSVYLNKLGTATGGSTNALFLGDGTEPAWTPPVYDASTGGEALRGLVQFRSTIMGLDDRGDFEEVSWEVNTLGSGSDMPARDLAYGLIASSSFGLGATPQVDAGPDGNVSSSYKNWCEACDWKAAGFVGEQTKKDNIEALALSTFSTVVYSEGRVKMVPLGSESTGSYVPPAPVALDANDIQDFEAERVPDNEVFNTWAVSYENRSVAGYDKVFVQYQDASHAAKHGIRRAEPVEAFWLKTKERAFLLAQLLCKQSLYQRWRARFTLSARYVLLEPGDPITVADGLVFTSPRAFRITAFDIRPDGRIEVEATEVSAGASAAIDLTPQDPVVNAQTAWSVATSVADVSGALVDKADTDLGNITASLGGGNLVRNSTFQGGADGWGIYNNAGAPTTATFSTFAGPNGDYYARVGYGHNPGNAFGIYSTVAMNVGGKTAGYPFNTGTNYVVSVWARANGGAHNVSYLQLNWNNPQPTVTAIVQQPVLVSSSWQRSIFKVSWASGSPNQEFYFDGAAWGGLNLGSSGSIDFQKVQIEEGDISTAWAPRTDEILPRTVDAPMVGPGSIPDSANTSPDADNLWPNGTSEVPVPAGLVTSSSDPEWAYISPSASYSGGYGRRLSLSGIGSVSLTASRPAFAGEAYVFSAWARLVSGTGAGFDVLRLRSYNSAGANLSTALSTAVTSSTWTQLVVTATMPANTARVNVELLALEPNPIAHITDFDGIGLYRQISSERYVVGSIQTQHLSASSITGDKIAAGQIKTSNYAEGTLNGVANSPLAGGKLDHLGTALKVAPGNFQIGSRNADQFGWIMAKSYLELSSSGGGSMSWGSRGAVGYNSGIGSGTVDLRVTYSTPAASGNVPTTLIQVVPARGVLSGAGVADPENWKALVMAQDSASFTFRLMSGTTTYVWFNTARKFGVNFVSFDTVG